MFLFLYKSFCLWYHAICYIISQLYAKFFGLDLVLHCVSAIWVFTKSIKCQTNAGLWEASELNLAHTLVVMSCSSCWADSFMLSWDTKLMFVTSSVVYFTSLKYAKINTIYSPTPLLNLTCRCGTPLNLGCSWTNQSAHCQKATDHRADKIRAPVSGERFVRSQDAFLSF